MSVLSQECSRAAEVLTDGSKANGKEALDRYEWHRRGISVTISAPVSPLDGVIDAEPSPVREHLQIGDFIDRVGKNGCRFVPAELLTPGDGRSWLSQQVFALRISQKSGLEAFREQCDRVELHPTLIYQVGPPDTGDDSYIAVFACDVRILDHRQALLTEAMLKKSLLEERSTPIATLTTVVPGGGRSIHTSDSALFSFFELHARFLQYMKSRDTTNFRKNLRKFQIPNANVSWDTGYFGLQSVELAKPQHKRISRDHRYINGLGKNSYYAVAWDAPTESDGRELALCVIPEKPKADLGEGLKTLQSKCQALRELADSQQCLAPSLRRLIATNLGQYRDGIARFRKLSKNGGHNGDWAICEWVEHFRPNAIGCEFCPHAHTCNHGIDIRSQLDPKGWEIRVSGERPKRNDLPASEQALSDAIENVFQNEDCRVHVVRSDTGLGKTQHLIKRMQSGVCMAFPTHALVEEFAQRSNWKRLTRPFCSTKRLADGVLPKEFADRLTRCDMIGNGQTHVYQDALKDTNLKPDQVTEIERKLDEHTGFMMATELCLTHEKAFQVTHGGVHTIVFDEDPFPNPLLPISKVNRECVRTAIEHLNSNGQHDLADELRRILEAQTDQLTTLQGEELTPEQNEILWENTRLTSNVGTLFAGLACVRTKSDSYEIVAKRELPTDRKHIILSATADPWIYGKLFGKRLHFVNLPPTELTGRVILHPEKSYSGHAIEQRKNGEARFVADVQEAVSKFGLDGVIVQKKHRELLVNSGVTVLAHFGALRGLDSLRGKNIGVFGQVQLNESTLKLYAHALGLAGTFDMRPRRVRRNGFDFKYYACSDSIELQNLQLAMIEAEVTQAIGRARVVRESANVHLFTRFPVNGVELNQD